ncbi:MAG: YfiT family bacillithiol transferase [Acidobacteriota bacterium]
MEDLRYPIGKFNFQEELNDEQIKAAIEAIAETPAKLRAAIAGLTDAQLDTPYREGGWTVRQVVHHVVDSHVNSYIRFRLALTEEVPTIKPYDEGAWAELIDAKTLPVEVSLALLEPLHERWVTLLRALTSEDLQREFRHPELGTVPLAKNIGLYAWHGKHHTTHITNLREREGWS